MQYVIAKKEQDRKGVFTFFVKDADIKQRVLSVETDPIDAKKFESEEEAKVYMKTNKMNESSGFSVAILVWPSWFAFSDRMPPEPGEYLVCSIKIRIDNVTSLKWDGEYLMMEFGLPLPAQVDLYNTNFTHWMHLPPAPPAE